MVNKIRSSHIFKIVLIVLLLVVIFYAYQFLHILLKNTVVLRRGTSDLAVINFVNNYHLPEIHSLEVFIDKPDKEVMVFKVTYGSANDCLSGCFYSSAVGLRYKNKLGWLNINDYRSKESDFRFYDFNEADSYLYTVEFFELLSMHDLDSYPHFLALLKHDTDVTQSVKVTVQERLDAMYSDHPE